MIWLCISSSIQSNNSFTNTTLIISLMTILIRLLNLLTRLFKTNRNSKVKPKCKSWGKRLKIILKSRPKNLKSKRQMQSTMPLEKNLTHNSQWRISKISYLRIFKRKCRRVDLRWSRRPNLRLQTWRSNWLPTQ